MIMKRILRTDRIRQPRGRFSFIPHRFLLDGFLKALSRDELLLYFFLVLTADKNGVSYYGQASICAHLQMAEDEYQTARDGLILRDLLAFDGVFFQVLELPERPIVLIDKGPSDLSALCRTVGNGGAL